MYSHVRRAAGGGLPFTLAPQLACALRLPRTLLVLPLREQETDTGGRGQVRGPVSEAPTEQIESHLPLIRYLGVIGQAWPL